MTRSSAPSPSSSPRTIPARSLRRELIARIILVVAAIGAAASMIGAFDTATGADDAMAVVAWHDLLGFPVYAVLFALLAWRPRGFPGVWELMILQKAVIAGVVAGLARGGADDAVLVATVDAVLAAALAVGYWLARADRAWTQAAGRD